MAGAIVKLSDDKVAVAADVGGTTTRIGMVDATYVPGAPLPQLTKFESRALRTDPVGVLENWIRDTVPSGKTLAAATVGLPTMFDADTRRVQSSPNIPELEGRDFAAEIGPRLGVPVVVDRDTVMMATGEWVAGAARGRAAVLGVFIGTGVGGAMLFDGTPYRGSSGAAVEIGHVPITLMGKPCICSNIDCLEAYASGHVLVDLAASADVPIDLVFDTPDLAPEIDGYIKALSCALSSAANLLDPEILVIGGGLAQRPRFPMARLIDEIRGHLRAPSPRESLVIDSAQLGSQAIIPGTWHLLNQI